MGVGARVHSSYGRKVWCSFGFLTTFLGTFRETMPRLSAAAFGTGIRLNSQSKGSACCCVFCMFSFLTYSHAAMETP